MTRKGLFQRARKLRESRIPAEGFLEGRRASSRQKSAGRGLRFFCCKQEGHGKRGWGKRSWTERKALRLIVPKSAVLWWDKQA